ncbi:MAG: SAM-dependent chlorinase/fluorinase [Deltaproteobacteria bacterium]|nr:SAM-dependent chlorinase/fluorinase [Deltaproteobacteria bacterium]
MERSGIITLLTDFGLSDAYVAMMKGVIFSINREAALIDITHSISTGSVFQGAYILRESFSYFPAGTVHVAVVDPGVGSNRRSIAVKAAGHFFTGPDNGIFWPIIERYKDTTIYELTEKKYFLPQVTSTFHGRDIFAPVAAQISLGLHIHQLGRVVSNPEKLEIPLPFKYDNTLTGQIIRIDNFGNLITNITANDLAGFLGNNEPVIHTGKIKIYGLSKIYSDRENGELLAIINSSNQLEIAVNMGKASDYIGKERDDIIGTGVKVEKTG